MSSNLPKLVRDNIPELIIKDGKNPVVNRVKNTEQKRLLLLAKLTEECKEYQLELSSEELVDIIEVCRALAKTHGIDWEHLLQQLEEKKQSNGGFDKGLILEKIT